MNIQEIQRAGERTPEELKNVLDGMERAIHTFYFAAVRLENHAFIEFAGLMHKYLELCQIAAENGIDFTTANIHSGKSLHSMETHDARYLGEKFGCIFQANFANDWKKIEAFMSTAFGLEREQMRAVVAEADTREGGNEEH